MSESPYLAKFRPVYGYRGDQGLDKDWCVKCNGWGECYYKEWFDEGITICPVCKGGALRA